MLLLLSGVLAVGWTWDNLPFAGGQPAVGKSVVLSDGRKLTLEGVTFGRDHRMERGKLAVRLIHELPPGWMPQSPWLNAMDSGTETGIARFSEPHMVLWFRVPPSSQSAASPVVPELRPTGKPPRVAKALGPTAATKFLRWRVLAPDGTGHGGTLNRSVGSGSMERLLPVAIDSYPRRQRRFIVQLFEPTDSGAVGEDAVMIGEFVVRNPNPSVSPEWQAETLPVRKESGGVTCVLDSFRVVEDAVEDSERETAAQIDRRERLIRPDSLAVRFCQSLVTFRGNHGSMVASGGGSFAFRDGTRQAIASFTVHDVENPRREWEVRQMLLVDPARNASYPRFWQWGPAQDGTRSLVCRTIPLWSDDAAWKLQLSLVDLGARAVGRLVRLDRIPFPGVGGARATTIETNVFGWRMKVHWVGETNVQSSQRTFREPSVLFEFDPTAALSPLASPMVELVEVHDDSGRALASTPFDPDVLTDLRRWYLRFQDPAFRLDAGPITVRWVDVVLAFPEERHFEFVVPSGTGARKGP